MDLTVCVATYGDDAWLELAERAVASALALEVPVVQEHADTLHESRNSALACVETEWVVFLDADDELEPGYVDALATGTADLRAPSVRYIQDGRAPREPYVPRVAGHRHDCIAECLTAGNWLVIGTAARTEQVRAAGGFEDWPVYEDWALWARMVKAGASVEAIPAAVYRAHVRPDSRNRAPSMDDKNATHHAIVEAVWG